MRRRRSGPPDSLELLLDTICNTFGGVLFLSILIAVLIRTSGRIRERAAEPAPIPQTVTAEEWYRAEAEYQRLLAERESLLKAIERRTALIGEIAAPGIRQTLEAAAALEERLRKALEEQRQALKDLAELQTKIRALEDERARLEGALATLRSQIDDAKRELDRQVKDRTQTSRLPHLRPSGKREVALVLRYGRLYVWHRWDALGNRLGVNTDDLLILSDKGDHLEVTPKPFAGTKITDDPADIAAVSKVLARFDPKEYYLAVLSYPDSFDRFVTLKGRMIEGGHEYRLIPTQPGKQTQDYGGRGGWVQ